MSFFRVLLGHKIVNGGDCCKKQCSGDCEETLFSQGIRKNRIQKVAVENEEYKRIQKRSDRRLSSFIIAADTALNKKGCNTNKSRNRWNRARQLFGRSM